MTLGVPDDGPDDGTIDPGSGPEDQNTLDMRDQPKVLASEIDSHMKGVVMMGYGYSGGAWMWVLGCLITVMLIVLVGLAGWAFATAMRSQRNEPVAQPFTPPTGERDRSRQVLDERYARGEMTTDEYNERRQTLAK